MVKNKRRSRRSKAAEQGWTTRTRNDGYKQALTALAKRNSVISTAAFCKDMGIAGYKMAYPKHYRRNSLAKAIASL